MAQFAYNNLFHSAISIALFMATKNFTPHSGTKILYEPEAAHTPNHNQELADAFICKMAVLKIECQQNIHYTQEHMAEQANCCWNPASNYQVEDNPKHSQQPTPCE